MNFVQKPGTLPMPLIPHKAGTTTGVRKVVNLNKGNGTVQYITSIHVIPY